MTVLESIKGLKEEFLNNPKKECVIEEEGGDILSLFSSSAIDILFNLVSCDSITLPKREELLLKVTKDYPELDKVLTKYDNEVLYINKLGNLQYHRITKDDEMFYLITGYCKINNDDDFDYNAFNVLVKKLNRISFSEGIIIGISEQDLLEKGAEISKIKMILTAHLNAGQNIKIIK